ncbi:cold-shock protein [Lapillicoccus sp.]|uniref:cold-shock protein n=1 Tax=Lapillicoccus sp. TaxID=1909287 RepID=UPI0032643266
MPTGKVKWYDADKGFGFLADDDGSDVFLHANALPEGVTTLKGGTRVEFGIVEGRRGNQALQLRVLDPAPSVVASQRAARRPPVDQMVPVVEDVIKVLDGISVTLRRGHYPDKAQAANIARALRRVADDLEG